MNRFRSAAMVFGLACTTTVNGQQQRNRMDPALRKMIIAERKGMDCAGIYQQTKLKLEMQFKLGTKVDTSSGLSSQTMATLSDVTTALGQSRRELCEFYKHDPEFTKDDYFRQVGELNKGESDAALLFQFASGKASAADLKTLQTVKAQESSTGTIDVNATLKEVAQTVDSVATRVTKAEQRINALESQTTELHSKAEQLEPLHQEIATATATVEVVIATTEVINTHYADSGGYLIFVNGNQALMVAASRDCFAVPHGKDQVLFRGVFNVDATDSAVGKPMTVLKSADHLQVGFRPMKPQQHVLGGRAVLIFNNAVRLEFEIPPQDMVADSIVIKNIAPALSKLQ